MEQLEENTENIENKTENKSNIKTTENNDCINCPMLWDGYCNGSLCSNKEKNN